MLGPHGLALTPAREKDKQMTEQATTQSNADNQPTAPAGNTAPEAPKPDNTPVDWEAKYKETLAEARKHEDRAKQNFDKAQKWDKYESEINPQQAQKIAELENEIATYKINGLRSEIAAKYNLNPVLAKRLSGSTAEELEADAKELQEAFGSEEPGKHTPPKPTKQQGTTSNTTVPAGGLSKQDFLNYLKTQQ